MNGLDVKRLTSHTWKRLLLAALLVLVVLTILFVFNASIPGRAVEGCPQGCATQSARRVGPLRVVDLNMLHGFPDLRDFPLRLDLIAAEIRRLDADVVLLEEAPWTRATGNGAQFLAQQLGYNYLYYRAEGNRHLIFFETGQAASLKEFVETHAAGLAMVGGDFNAREDSPQIVDLSSSWTNAYRALHPGDPGLTCCIDNLTTGPGEPLEERIDYIFSVTKREKGGRIVSARHVFDQPFPVCSGWQWPRITPDC